jgi:hypothetical protein
MKKYFFWRIDLDSLILRQYLLKIYYKMKKIILSAFSVALAISASAQLNEKSVLFSNPNIRTESPKTLNVTPKNFTAERNSKLSKKRAGAQWMSYQDATSVSGTAAAVLYPMYPDSSLLVVPTPPNAPFHWWVHGLGTSFDPASTKFSNPDNPSYNLDFSIGNGNAFSIDSILVVGKYYREKNYTDTLIVEIAAAPGTGGTAANGTLLFAKDVWFYNNLNLTDSTLRFVTAQYDHLNNKISDNVTTKIVIKKVLGCCCFCRYYLRWFE